MKLINTTFGPAAAPWPRPRRFTQGNAASVHIRALDALCDDPALSGRCIVAADDTPTDSDAFVAPLVAGQGIFLIKTTLPYPLALAFAVCISTAARLLALLFPSIGAARLPRPSDIRYIYSGTTFDKSEAEKVPRMEALSIRRRRRS
ncbi:hypothetical protein MTO96_032913 [Rhipicephalus appendiculatus]